VLEGMTQTLIIDPQDALVLKASINSRAKDLPPQIEPTWDRETQIIRNQPAIEKIRSLIAKMESSEVSTSAAAEFERFKEIVDSERPDGQKLYIVIATTNVKHLSRFANALEWSEINL
jgi:hypothetical protein